MTEKPSLEMPFLDSADHNKELTVSILKKILNDLSSDYDDYLVSFDSALGYVIKGDFTIYNQKKRISING